MATGITDIKTMMRPIFALFLSLLTPALSPAQDVVREVLAIEAADSHAELADALVALLQRTVTTLEQCTDEASVSAAIPQLKQQQEEAAQLMARQAALPEPTVQDYMAAQARANDFLDAKRAIQTHISRLQTEGLMTAEIRRILGIAPETQNSDE